MRVEDKLNVKWNRGSVIRTQGGSFIIRFSVINILNLGDLASISNLRDLEPRASVGGSDWEEQE